MEIIKVCFARFFLHSPFQQEKSKCTLCVLQVCPVCWRQNSFSLFQITYLTKMLLKIYLNFCFRDLFSLVGTFKKLVPGGFFFRGFFFVFFLNKPLHLPKCPSHLYHHGKLHFPLSLWHPLSSLLVRQPPKGNFSWVQKYPVIKFPLENRNSIERQ